uniref:Lysidine-tRNA(Ile) synthetase C-terminal domain-containing protein n=1 Tax=Magnetospirillum gryphiswaldense TaxID=55518 RepID=A4TVW0_9PROT|nr:conserved hypothetical protein [Magnetospirillum gryphiswaldense MSR-1]
MRQRDQDWVDDPFNIGPRHARVPLRLLADTLAAEGLEPGRLAQTARTLAVAGDALNRMVADAVVEWVDIHPPGFAWVRSDAWGQLPEDVALRLLVRLLCCHGGEEFPPRLERSQSLLRRLRHGQGGTLAGCRVMAAADGRVLFCREAGRMAEPVSAEPGAEILWDGRFRAVVPAQAPPGLRLGGLGPQGWGKVVKAVGRGRLPDIPAMVRATLPVLMDEDGVFAAPHLGYNRRDQWQAVSPWLWPAPRRSLTEIAHCLV